jgi:predicted metal-binding membrane protein
MASSAPDLTSRILRHERLIVAAGIVALVALGWWFLVSGAGMAEGMAMAGMTAMAPPLAALVLMWWVMMAAMMLPSATPAILLYARVRHARSRDATIAGSWVFLAGYLAVWLLFALIAAVAQRLLTGASMALDNRIAEGVVLVLAGLYQLSPLKAACLRQCRSPAQFLSRYWQPGVRGAVQLGLLHGAYCLGCCWVLMLLLFVGGVMNLLWVVALTLIVAVEKLVPQGERLAQILGIGLVLWGLGRIAAF